ncbi:MAG TPA: DNA mismatch repair endonuclease MutL [Gemmatimonadaceae bacterium]|nr:DNA mismatch repair endonuclease MutL [Gemmatimonadaceae bacterium]
MTVTVSPVAEAAARIAVLASAVADQIAAGEVVERPASALKELVENALDAGATRIDIAVENGGLSSIRVSDDGWGMSSDDARLAIERHATSKIRAVEDLVGVATFGFRGEALPSIASVSRFELVSAPNAGPGTRLRVAGGALESFEEAVRQKGTTVTVRDLFYNVPARKKFLRSERSEWRAIMDVVSNVALARRNVHLTIQHQGKPVLDLPAAQQLRVRLATLWGTRAAERFIEVRDIHGPMLVTGLVERPADVGTATRRTALFVNGRPIRDAGLIRAAEAAYRSVIPAGIRPSLVLELALPGIDVDVNVHPAKAEVRFKERWPVERAVEAAVRRALGTPESAARFMHWRPASAATGGGPNEHSAAPRESLDTLPVPVTPSDADTIFAESDASRPTAGDTRSSLPSLLAPEAFQLRQTYLVYEHDEGVVVVDQHSAHERILYERIMRAFESGTLPSQRLLFPETLHLSAAEMEALEAHRSTLEKIGFQIEDFGGQSIVVHSVPVLHRRFDALRCLRETLAGMTGDRAAATHGRHEKLVATLACRAAIKAGDPLQPGEARALLGELAHVSLAAHDVHGRSAVVRLSWDELERRFGRR